METKEPIPLFFNKKIQELASSLSLPHENVETINGLHEFEKKLDEKLYEFEEIFFKASPKLKTVLWYNPHMQAFILGAKSAMWVNFGEMFPGDIMVWQYLMRIKQLFHDHSVKCIFEELTHICPDIVMIKDNFVGNIKGITEKIFDNSDIFSDIRKVPFVSVTEEETQILLQKISQNLSPKNIPEVRNMIGILLGYPRDQVFMHKIIDHLDLQIFIPRFNDFTSDGFYYQTLPLIKEQKDRDRLFNLFSYLQEMEIMMNRKARSFQEQEAIHKNIIEILVSHQSFLRTLIFENYLPQSMSQKAADVLDDYILCAIPRRAFPETFDICKYGISWMEYKASSESDYIKGKILLAIKKISRWKKMVWFKYEQDLLYKEQDLVSEEK